MATVDQTPQSQISGLLHKKRGGFGKMMMSNWVYRLFSISTDGIFSYYDTDNPEILRGKMNLNQVQFEISVDPIEGSPKPFCIKIKHLMPVDEAWNLCTDTKKDHDQWLQVLEKYLIVYTPPADISPEGIKRNGSDSALVQKASRRLSGLNSMFAANNTSSSSPPPSPTTSSRTIKPLNTGPATTNQSTVSPPKKSTNTKKKKVLRTASAKSSAFSNELVESICTGLIVNICIYGLITTTLYKLQIFYFAVVNIVVLHTLSLRTKRLNASEVASEKIKLELEDQLKARLVADSEEDFPVGQSEQLADEVNAPLGNGEKPIPGGSFREVVGQVVTQSTVLPANQSHSWCKVDPRVFNVRVGPDYNRHKKKAPSVFSIYEPFAIDVFCTKLRVDHAASRFQLPDFGIDTHNEFVPPIFIIQLQMPSEPPASLFSKSEDGPGWAIVMYYRITEEAVRQLADIQTASPAVQLFARWCEMAPQNAAWRGRFKVICNCSNIAELGIPSAISAYNAKPVLIRKTGSILRGEANRYMEMDIHVHKFANLAKQSIFHLSSRCGLMNMQIGFVVEGRENEELPEAVFACVAVNKPQEEEAEFLFEDDN